MRDIGIVGGSDGETEKRDKELESANESGQIGISSQEQGPRHDTLDRKVRPETSVIDSGSIQMVEELELRGFQSRQSMNNPKRKGEEE